MSCNSTYLLDGVSDHGIKADELTTLLSDHFEQPGAKAVVSSTNGVADTAQDLTTPQGSSIEAIKPRESKSDLTARENPWAPLIDVGLKLAESLKGGSNGDSVSQWIEADPRSGKSYLKIPIPEPAAVQRLAEALVGLLSGLRR